MFSEFRNRLRQSGRVELQESAETGLNGTASDDMLAWEHVAVETLYETKTQLTQVEAEWREKIYQQLLKVMDLSLLDSLEQADAIRQIREICSRLLDEHSAPVSSSSRQLIIKQLL